VSADNWLARTKNTSTVGSTWVLVGLDAHSRLE
jgi:hypothetical protein